MPRGVMPAETRRLACAKREARRRQTAALREGSTLSIGPYRVYRGDELNWFVTRAGHATRYYGTLAAALSALLDERLGDRATANLPDVAALVEAAKRDVADACRELEARLDDAAGTSLGAA